MHHFKVLKDYLLLLILLLHMLQLVVTQIIQWVLKKSFLPRAEINNYNVLIYGRNSYDQQMNDIIKQYDEVKKKYQQGMVMIIQPVVYRIMDISKTITD